MPDVLQIPANRPKIPEVRRRDIAVPKHANDDSQHDQSYQRACLRESERILDELAELQTTSVHPRQQRYHRDADQLSRRKREGIAR